MQISLLLPAHYQTKPKLFIRKRKEKPEGRSLSAWPSSFSMKSKLKSRSPKAYPSPRRISLPLSSLLAFYFSSLESIPLSKSQEAFIKSPFVWGLGVVLV